ncbi:cell division protein SepF [Lucifera butyrica]|nr:cell division protein SepF [Lucifera butyrica]
MDKVWGSLGLFEPVDGVEEEKHPRFEEPEVKVKKTNTNNVVSLPTNPKQMKVMIVEPFSFDDAQHVADHLKNRKPVVVNLESTDKDIAKRIIDFISGTTYAVSGSIQKIGNQIFLCAPNNVDVAYSPQDDNMDKVFMSWSSNK